MVFELHDMRIVCLLKAVTPAWVINMVSFTLNIGYIHHSGSFEILQANVNVPYRSGPRALNKITPRVVDRFMYLSCILVSVTR